MNKHRLNNRNSKIERKYGIKTGTKSIRFQVQYGIFRDVTTNPESQFPD